jgi:hypothetical protein
LFPKDAGKGDAQLYLSQLVSSKSGVDFFEEEVNAQLNLLQSVSSIYVSYFLYKSDFD